MSGCAGWSVKVGGMVLEELEGVGSYSPGQCSWRDRGDGISGTRGGETARDSAGTLRLLFPSPQPDIGSTSWARAALFNNDATNLIY